MVRFTATTPLEDCALAFALPMLDDAAFLQAMHDPEASDFLREQFAGGSQSLLRDARQEKLRQYHELIVKAHEVFGFCRAHGVEVVEQATLGDLRRLFTERGVVTLVAHWRGSEFRGPDVLVGPEEFLHRLDSGGDVIARTLGAALTAAWRRKLTSAEDLEDGRNRVAAFLNSALQATARPLASVSEDEGPGLVRIHDASSLEAENRKALEAWEPQWFQHGNRVELLDGLHDVPSIDANVPRDYEGIFDLTVCRSSILGEALKQTRPQMRIIRHRYPVPVARALNIYKATLQLVANGWNYAQAIIDLHEGLLSLRSL